MKSTIIYYNVLILLLASMIKAQVDNFLNFHLQQDRIQCIGVRCPSERPTCVVENRIAKCVAETLPSNSNSNRLSRPAPGLSLSRPPPEPPLNSNNPFQSKRVPASNAQDASGLTRVPTFCFEPPQSGRCRAFFRSFYFNPRSGRCESFIYGGCGGNNNRFRYERDCKVTCTDPFTQAQGVDNSQQTSASLTAAPSIPPTQNPQVVVPVCHLNADPGPCFALKPRFYFNKEAQQCEGFNYGGCQGNQNNFESLAACQQTCANTQQNTASGQNNGQSSTPFPAMSMPSMPPFTLLNSNLISGSSLFDKLEAAQTFLDKFTPDLGLLTAAMSRPAACNLPKKVGPCRARVPRYFFNNETQMCEQFFYGGCQANMNNFQSERECFQTCGNSNVNGNRPFSLSQMQPFPFWTDPSKDAAFREFLIRERMEASGNMMGGATFDYFVCTQPMNQGSCFEKIQSFFFNSQSGNCEPFVFRGCGGNRNRFKTMEACQNFCLRDAPVANA